MKILVIAAHPDDETLGCGGTIARLASDGHEVWCCAMADGVTSRFPGGRSTSGIEPLMRARFQQFLAAAHTLGAHAYMENTPLPDQQLDQVPMLTLAQTIGRIVDVVQAEVVYTHSGADLNQDHVAIHRATLIATRPVPGCPVREVYAYEVPSATEWAFGQFGTFRPTVFVDVDATLDAKIRALECYEGELREWPHPRSVRGISALAEARGMAAGMRAAEAFEVVRICR